MANNSHLPVIVGIGEAIDRESRLEPKDLLLESIGVASKDAAGILPLVNSIDVVSIHSWRYRRIADLLGVELSLRLDRAEESSVGGEKPIRLLVEAAERIASGECKAALVCGAEATRTQALARRSARALDWGPTDTDVRPVTALDFVTPLAARYGLIQAAHVYPLYENAARHAWRQTAADAENESALLGSRYSQAATLNPYAWLNRAYSADEIKAAGIDNRRIAYPYRKLMVANPAVNQAGAVLVTSLAAARRVGIPENRIVYIWGGARANEPLDFLGRDRYDRSVAQETVLLNTLSRYDVQTEDIDLFEFYSCFPIVPKMARRVLGLGDDVQPSVAGGLTFFGGPANNYMTHAITAAVRAIRAKRGNSALLYGQGEFVTKHATALLANQPSERPVAMYELQAVADANAETPPRLREDYEGDAFIETFTVVYDRNEKALFAPIVARTLAGDRIVAMAGHDDPQIIEQLTSASSDPIGASGRVERQANGLLRFTVSP